MRMEMEVIVSSIREWREGKLEDNIDGPGK